MARRGDCVIKSDLKIRPIQPGDADGLIKLINAGTAAVPALAKHLPDAIRHRIEGGDQKTFRLVALVAAEIIGQAALTFGFAPQLSTGRLTMLIRADQRSRGVGTALLAALLARAKRDIGLTRIELAVLSDNQAAIHLYRHFGFAEEARQSGVRGCEALLMARSI
ncbi:GNAT family N-acetyltransferase [Methyloferula stellata]|uniref:GNAT family N-acetyltransferase n=1 Tax=Methyloferula stellata TaxID=876270 RepID=UPI00036CA36E|nr:GNAT family N-acetyltransferase [Methyloferula stellata]